MSELEKAKEALETNLGALEQGSSKEKQELVEKISSLETEKEKYAANFEKLKKASQAKVQQLQEQMKELRGSRKQGDSEKEAELSSLHGEASIRIEMFGVKCGVCVCVCVCVYR